MSSMVIGASIGIIQGWKKQPTTKITRELIPLFAIPLPFITPPPQILLRVLYSGDMPILMLEVCRITSSILVNTGWDYQQYFNMVLFILTTEAQRQVLPA